jgi:NTP pyrophosphatase (non-canonical NTP hydrolase)
MTEQPQTDFQKVVDFNYNFGVIPTKDFKPNPNIITEDPSQVEFCLKLIREEVKELEEAVKDNDYVETVDALVDIMYVVLGMASRIGIDMDIAFDIVHRNNMSKLCKTKGAAQASVKYYNENTEKLGYDSPAYRKAPDDIHWVVYNESTKKILKSINWNPVDLTTICSE